MIEWMEAFGEGSTIDAENRNARVLRAQQVPEDALPRCCGMLEKDGFAGETREISGVGRFATYRRGNSGVFLNYYFSTGELTAVLEEESPYFAFSDSALAPCLPPQIIQLHLEDFGMSYAVRLSDGRFILLDGGRELEPDADRLMETLKEASPHEKPVIGAWILSHPHPDHYYCFFKFLERHREKAVIEKVLLNFPEADDLTHYPKLVSKHRREEGVTANAHMLRLQDVLRDLGVSLYYPHTGQIYRIGDAVLEILASMDDTIGISDNINAASLVIRMELGGQITLWATDASFEAARLPERYGQYLKADILQVPHHGFRCGDSHAAMAGYRLIAPKVCLMPVSEYNAFTAFCAYRECTRYLMTRCDVKEFITGDTTRTLTLPYTPDPMGEKQLWSRYLEGQENAGARIWVFTGLHTEEPEDFRFTILNTTHANAEIMIELFFENGPKPIRFIKAEVSPLQIRRICITDGNDVNRDAVYYNPWSLEKNEIPSAAFFAVRFMSNIPVVVSHAKHRDSYHTTHCHL